MSQQRKACRYLGLSQRVAGYALKQRGKDRHMGDRLLKGGGMAVLE
jgi:hypothetical protein